MAVPDSLTAMQLFLSQIRVGKVEAKGKGALNGYWGAFIQAYVAFAGFAQVHMGIFSAGTLLLGFVLGMTFYHLAFGAGSHTEPGIVQDKKLNWAKKRTKTFLYKNQNVIILNVIIIIIN